MEERDIAARRASRWFAASLAVGLSVVATLNFLVDPYDLYPPSLLRPITFSSHREAARLLREAEPAPEALVLGTSRVGKLDPAYLEARTGHPAFNANLNAATAETLLAYFRYALDVLPRPPRLMIVGLDARSFSNAIGIDEQLINTRSLAREVPEYVGVAERMPVWLRLLNYYQLEDSIESLWMAITGDYPEPQFRFAADGRRLWRDDATAADAAALERSTRELAENITDQYRRYDALSPQRREAFETLVELARQAGTELILYTTPVHPALQGTLEQRPNFVPRQEELTTLARQAADGGFTFVDLANLDAHPLDPDDWLDSIHHGEATGRVIIDRLLDARSR